MNQMNDAQLNRQPLDLEISDDQIAHQLELILESRHFRQAKSLENFLRYVVEKKLTGNDSELKEYTIGVEVFHRGVDFDPRKDAVVRVQANVLRKRLASYYEDDSALDEVVIEIPKGHYVPQFQRRSLSSAQVEPPENATAEELSGQVVLPDLPPNLPAALPNAGSRFRWKIPALVAATFVLGLMTAIGGQNWLSKRTLAGAGSAKSASLGSAPDRSSADPAYLPLWEKFLEPGVENILAYGTPQFFVADGVYLRDVKINSPQDAGVSSRLMSLQKASHLDFKPTEVYTGVGETHGVHLLTRFFDQTANNLRVARSRMVGWGEMKNSNIVFLSSMRFHTLAKELPYPSDFEINPGVTGSVINLRPQEGESAVYGGTEALAYAVITVWPGKLQQRRIMVLSGSNTWATLAVAEYVTDPEYLQQLNQHLEQCRIRSGHAQHAPFFQVLLRTEIKDNQPISISYATHHDLEIPDSASPDSIDNVARLTSGQK